MVVEVSAFRHVAQKSQSQRRRFSRVLEIAVGALLWGSSLGKCQRGAEEKYQMEIEGTSVSQSASLFHDIKIPAIEADIKFAIVPASMARNPDGPSLRDDWAQVRRSRRS